MISWEKKKLGDVLKLEYGKPLAEDKRISNGRYPVYGANGEKGRTNEFYFDKRTIIVGRKGSAGEINLSEEKFWPLDVTYFVTFNEKRYNLLFLYYLFSLLELPKLAKGVKPGINRNEVYDIAAKFPQLLEQQRIVKILEKAFAAIDKAKENAEKNLQNAKELFESYLFNIFEKKGEDWEQKALKELTTVLGDGLHGTPKYTIEGDYYFINGNNLNDGSIEFKESTKRVSIDEYSKHKKKLTDRTILVSINGTLGNVAFYNDEKIILGKSACYFNLIESVDKNFIRYVLSSPYFLKYAHNQATGATIKNVSLKSMREFLVPLPPLKVQQTIVKKLDALSSETKKLEAIYKQKIAVIEELKKSILQKALNGELN